MIPALPRVVFDTSIFLQSILSERGPSAACLNRCRRGEAALLISEAVLVEVRDVLTRPKLMARFSQLTLERVEAFIGDFIEFASMVTPPPSGFSLPRDPDDLFLIDLAAAGDANYLVTWNERHLTYLMNGHTPEGRAFLQRFPALKIVSPISFLAVLDVNKTH